MGYISCNNTYGIYNNQYCILGMYCSDTDLVEIFSLDSKKRVIVDIDAIDIIKDEKVIETIKVLYGK